MGLMRFILALDIVPYTAGSTKTAHLKTMSEFQYNLHIERDIFSSGILSLSVGVPAYVYVPHITNCITRNTETGEESG